MDRTHPGYKSYLAREMFKIIFARIGRVDLDAARAMVNGFTKEQADQLMAEAKLAISS